MRPPRERSLFDIHHHIEILFYCTKDVFECFLSVKQIAIHPIIFINENKIVLKVNEQDACVFWHDVREYRNVR